MPIEQESSETADGDNSDTKHEGCESMKDVCNNGLDEENEMDQDNFESHSDEANRDVHNRNKTFHGIYLDSSGYSCDLIGVTDDYVVKLSTYNYKAWAYSLSHPEHARLMSLVKKCRKPDMEDHKYNVGLLYKALSLAIPSRIEARIDLMPWV